MKLAVAPFWTLLYLHVCSVAAATTYLSAANGVSVSVGASSVGSFQNLPEDTSLANVIDLSSADATEVHTQSSHVWWAGGQLELVFDLGASYDVCQFHFWNYFGSSFSVDTIALTFQDASGSTIAQVDLNPSLGAGSTVAAESFDLTSHEICAAKTVTALLDASNSQLDFNNAGFTACDSLSCPAASPATSSPTATPQTPSPPPPSICFAPTTTVQVQDVGPVPLADLKMGSKVLSDGEKYETVYAMAHNKNTLPTDYLQIFTNHARTPLEVSADHYLYLRDGNFPIRADQIKVGDVLGGQGVLRVTAIGKVTRNGRNSPLTTSGKVVVNGNIQASSYADFDDKDKLLGRLTDLFAHVGLAPFRFYCTVVAPGGADAYCMTYSADDTLPLGLEMLKDWYDFAARGDSNLALRMLLFFVLFLACVTTLAMERLMMVPFLGWMLMTSFALGVALAKTDGPNGTGFRFAKSKKKMV